MSQKEPDALRGALARRVTAAFGVGLATSGLSSCIDNGAVDPPPPPFSCSTDVMQGQGLLPVVARAADSLTVRVANAWNAGWATARVDNLVGLQSISIEAQPQPFGGVTAVFALADSTIGSAQFDLLGTLRDERGSLCNVARTFSITLDPLGVSSRMPPALPLESRDTPVIVPVRQAVSEGRTTVHLEARSTRVGMDVAEWSVTGGSLERVTDTEVRWTLPSEPGLYQIDVVIAYGANGVGYDALALEVGP